MDKGVHCAWGLKLAQEAADVGAGCDKCQARFRDRLCYSQYPGLNEGMKGSVSKWEREVGFWLCEGEVGAASPGTR